MTRFNPIRGTFWTRWSWARVIVLVGAVGTIAAVAVVTIVFAILGVGSALGFVVLFAVVVALPLGVACTLATLAGGSVGRRVGAMGEVAGVVLSTLAVTVAASLWMNSAYPYFAPFVAGGGALATVGFGLTTLFYRAAQEPRLDAAVPNES